MANLSAIVGQLKKEREPGTTPGVEGIVLEPSHPSIRE
jgi:hypothetical protein